MNDRLVAIEDRLFRADENLDVLKGLLRAYYASDAFRLFGDFDPDEDRGIRMNGAFRPPEIRVFTLIGDILHEFRSSLDWLTWQLVEENGAGQPDDSTKWPVLHVAPTAPEKGPNRGINPPPHVRGGVSEEAIAIIDEAQPYKWGENYASHPLYMLHWLNIRDKHRHIVIRGIDISNVVVYGDDPIPPFTWTAEVIKSDEDGAQVRFVPNDPEVDVQIPATLQVMLFEETGGANTPLLQTLTQIRDAVWATFLHVERECFPP